MKNIITKAASNTLKLGVAILASSVINQTVRELTNETLSSIAQGIRKAKNEFHERKLHDAA